MKHSVTIDWQEINRIIDSYDADRESLLMIMQDIGDLCNYLPPEVLPVLAERLGVRESMIYSVATFYKTIGLEPRGRYIISVCTGTACHVRGAQRIMEAVQEKLNLEEGETTDDALFTLQSVRCVGCCASGPVLTVNKETYGGLDRSMVLKIIDYYKKRDS
ncbi:MAG: NAD(P)H-dependent oxidoreductase subunit E [Deltaproteobacteria bacterium]|nr:NAD(P)H-dependent oxidoreductase subunit E [Deltaproteobacteria bacterium]MBW2341698.1 NAD(P)H-dependent oxidoreductase subunit E [Deltaproteobacteria bacterium]